MVLNQEEFVCQIDLLVSLVIVYYLKGSRYLKVFQDFRSVPDLINVPVDIKEGSDKIVGVISSYMFIALDLLSQLVIHLLDNVRARQLIGLLWDSKYLLDLTWFLFLLLFYSIILFFLLSRRDLDCV